MSERHGAVIALMLKAMVCLSVCLSASLPPDLNMCVLAEMLICVCFVCVCHCVCLVVIIEMF